MWVLAGAAVVGGVAMAVAAMTVRFWGRASVTRDRRAMPATPMVIVPGAGVFPDGRPSLTLRDRLDAAAELYATGMGEHILVSGANDLPDFDEPIVMHRHLVARGVPSRVITLDSGGVNTWATCRRARQMYGVERAVFVTQHPYANRAATLCRAAGLDATVLSIDPPRRRRRNRMKARAREALANVKACYIVLTH